MATARKLNAQHFPRPPLVEKTPRHVQIRWHGQLVADCPPGEAFWVLERGLPPTYYIPPSTVCLPLSTSARTSYCEWKGMATYYSLMSPVSAADTIQNRIWSYNDPQKGYEAIKGHLAFYSAPWECYVDGERVQPQPGDFYGGWVTSDVEGLKWGEGGVRSQWQSNWTHI